MRLAPLLRRRPKLSLLLNVASVIEPAAALVPMVFVLLNRRNAPVFVARSRLAVTTVLLRLLPPLLATTTEGAGAPACWTPAVRVKLLIWPPLRVKMLLTWSVCRFAVSDGPPAAVAPLKVPPRRVKALLLMKLLTEAFWPRVMAALVNVFRASSPGWGKPVGIQWFGSEYQSATEPSQFRVMAWAGCPRVRPSETRATALPTVRRRFPRPSSRRRMVGRTGLAGVCRS